MTDILFQYIRKGQKVKRIKDPKTGEKRDITVCRGKIVGTMVAFIDELNTEMICIGFSRYSSAKESVYNWKTNTFELRLKERILFNPFIGKEIAKARADRYAYDNKVPKFCEVNPTYVHRQFIKFADRAERYFKGAVLPEWFSIYRDYHENKGE